MDELGIPKEMVDSYWKLHCRLAASGREIDHEFIRRGFLSVQALMNRQNALFGPGGYEESMKIKSDPQLFEKYRQRRRDILMRLSEREASSGQVSDDDWSEILSNVEIDGGSKLYLLGRFFPEKYRRLSETFEPALAAARHEEMRRVCSLFPEPAASLLSDERMALRKEACNRVMADAYGALGFKQHSRRQGIDALYKPLTPQYAIIVKVDSILLNKSLADFAFSSPADLRLSFGKWTYLGSSQKSDKRCWFTFLPINNCIASNLGQSYDDTRSLEVAIRANALWYELMVAPFEQAVQATSSGR